MSDTPLTDALMNDPDSFVMYGPSILIKHARDLERKLTAEREARERDIDAAITIATGTPCNEHSGADTPAPARFYEIGKECLICLANERDDLRAKVPEMLELLKRFMQTYEICEDESYASAFAFVKTATEAAKLLKELE